MRRGMSLWRPRWPIDRRRSGRRPAPDKPFVLALSVGNRRLVSAANAAAEALGVVPGLPLTDARALHPALAVAEADPAGGAQALRRLAQWCNRYSPWTAPWGADGVVLDVTGCAHLRGGEASLVRDMVERLQQLGIAGRAAIADSAGAAWAVVRCGSVESAVVPQHETRAALAVLPIAALRLDPVAALQLERLGLRRIGDLYALQRASLAARLGDGGGRGVCPGGGPRRLARSRRSRRRRRAGRGGALRSRSARPRRSPLRRARCWRRCAGRWARRCWVRAASR